MDWEDCSIPPGKWRSVATFEWADGINFSCRSDPKNRMSRSDKTDTDSWAEEEEASSPLRPFSWASARRPRSIIRILASVVPLGFRAGAPVLWAPI